MRRQLVHNHVHVYVGMKMETNVFALSLRNSPSYRFAVTRNSGWKRKIEKTTQDFLALSRNDI